VLQRTMLEFSYASITAGKSFSGAYGVQVAKVGATGTWVASINDSDPYLEPQADWILHGYFLGSVVTGALAILGAQMGGVGTRVESKARRKLAEDEVLIFSMSVDDEQGISGQIGQIQVGWRCLFKGR